MYDVQVRVEWAEDESKVKNLVLMLQSGMNEEDCARVLGVPVASVAVVAQTHPQVKRAALEALDKQRFTLVRDKIQHADKILGKVYNIAMDDDEKTADQLNASKLYLTAVGVVGPKAQAAEQRMEKGSSDGKDTNVGANETLLRLLNHAMDRRQEESASAK